MAHSAERWLAFLAHPFALIAAFLLINGVGFIVFDASAFDPTWRYAAQDVMLAHGAYSPFPWFITRFWQALFGAGELSGVAFRWLIYGLALLFIYRASLIVFGNRIISAFAIYLTLLSPQIAYSLYTGRDTSFDLFGAALIVLVAAQVYVGTPRTWWLLALVAAFATNLREANLILLPASVALLWLMRRMSWRQAIFAVLIFFIGLAPLLAWNYQRVGVFTISTRSAYNLYVGNHPLYLAGYPAYEPGILFRARVPVEFADEFATLDTTRLGARYNLPQSYQDQAIAFMLADPIETLYRMLIKAIAWWGPLDNPLDVGYMGYLDAEADVILLSPSTTPAIFSLAGTLHRLVVLALLLSYWRNVAFRWREALFFALPTLALMLVAMLTHPMTRFRLPADPALHVLAALGLALILSRWMPNLIAPKS